MYYHGLKKLRDILWYQCPQCVQIQTHNLLAHSVRGLRNSCYNLCDVSTMLPLMFMLVEMTPTNDASLMQLFTTCTDTVINNNNSNDVNKEVDIQPAEERHRG